MKSPCNDLAGAGLGSRRAARKEDARVIAVRNELRAFLAEIKTVLDTRLAELNEQILRGEIETVHILTEAKALTVIAEAVAREFCIKTSSLYSDERTDPIVIPRQAAMYLARNLTKATLNQIGSHFGGRDHGTVLWAIESTENRMQTQPRFKRAITVLKNRLSARLASAEQKEAKAA